MQNTTELLKTIKSKDLESFRSIWNSTHKDITDTDKLNLLSDIIQMKFDFDEFYEFHIKVFDLILGENINLNSNIRYQDSRSTTILGLIVTHIPELDSTLIYFVNKGADINYLCDNFAFDEDCKIEKITKKVNFPQYQTCLDIAKEQRIYLGYNGDAIKDNFVEGAYYNMPETEEVVEVNIKKYNCLLDNSNTLRNIEAIEGMIAHIKELEGKTYAEIVYEDNKDLVIIHIPHSSTFIPNYKGYNPDVLGDEVEKLTDWHTDKIFDIKNVSTVKANFSRVFCDVERLPDNEEPMYQLGRGFYYNKTDNGKLLHNVDEAEKNKVKANYYDKHHNFLTDLVDSKLKKNGATLIIDAHSFSDTPFSSDLDKSENRPDICIGTDEFHISKILVSDLQEWFEFNGYSVKINSPYEGSIVPIKHYKKNKNVKSIMIEVNRKLYLNDDLSANNEEVQKLNEIINSFITGEMESHLKLKRMLEQSEKDIEEDKTISHEELMEEMKDKYGI